jgi:hypothetical protein
MKTKQQNSKVKFKLNGEIVVGQIVHNIGYGRYGILYENDIYNVDEKDIIPQKLDHKIRSLAKDGIIIHKDFISVPCDYKGGTDLTDFRKPIIQRLF